MSRESRDVGTRAHSDPELSSFRPWRNTDYFGAPNEFLGQELPPGAKTGGEKFGRFKKRPVWPAPYLGQLAESHVTLAEAFKEAGYATCVPGVTKAGTTSAQPVTSTDFYPTLMEACGLPLRPDQHVDGASFLPALADPAKVVERPLFWHYPHWGNQGGTPGSAVRLGPWKLIRWAWGKEPELFNLERDPGETKNLAASEPGKLKEMNGILDGLLEETQAIPPTENPEFQGGFKKSG